MHGLFVAAAPVVPTNATGLTPAQIAELVGEGIALLWIAYHAFMGRKKAAEAGKKADAAEMKAGQVLEVVQKIENRLQQSQSQAVTLEQHFYNAGTSGSGETKVQPPTEVPPPPPLVGPEHQGEVEAE